MFRIDGELHPAADFDPWRPTRSSGSPRPCCRRPCRSSSSSTRQLDFSFSWKDLTRFRGNVFRQRGAVSMALRAIPYQIPTLEELLLPPVMSEFCTQRQGLVLMTGPTGSGKSTTPGRA